MLTWNSTIYGIEEIKTRYLGIGASIEEVEQATFMVDTEGKKQGEGFVYTPDKMKSKENITFEVSLEGKNKTVFLKLVETDANGRFITEHTTPMILLTSEWKKYKLSAKTSEKTAQVDVFVLTEEEEPTQFKFRDVQVK
ncbi:hypothetical protein [Ornithinibacillus scapharcae]|uniref:hypothetical protein n=1 Tax=Ornithinibacillus scapharcae TaxID=1147159 RepID=UPI00031F3F7A|nr:hypothetical protein [Ornithinibacillus scapharcae]